MNTGTKASMTPGLTSMQSRAPAVLEHEDEQPVGGAGREQVEDDRLDRDHDRVERHEQQQEREAEHEDEHQRHAVLVEPDDVEGVGGVAR